MVALLCVLFLPNLSGGGLGMPDCLPVVATTDRPQSSRYTRAQGGSNGVTRGSRSDQSRLARYSPRVRSVRACARSSGSREQWLMYQRPPQAKTSAAWATENHLSALSVKRRGSSEITSRVAPRSSSSRARA